jgi:NDP-sugar pyrophosphorylase family protein
MKGLILAAGEGTRLRPLTLDRPKPMLDVGGRPILEHLVALLRVHGVTEIAINLHYKPEAIVSHFGDGSRFGVSITYSPEERLLGSAGAARQLATFLDEPFIVLYGDVLTDLDLTDLAARHRAASATATIALYEVEDPTRVGIVSVDAAGRVTSFVEKPPASLDLGRLANAGIYVVEPTVLELIPSGQPFDFGHDVFPLMLKRGLSIHGRPAEGYVLDIGSPERYHQAEDDYRAGRFRSPADPSGRPVTSTPGAPPC